MKLVKVPPSKSISNRALILGMLSDSTKIIRNILKSDDTSVMIEAYDKLGVRFEILNETETAFDVRVFGGISVSEAKLFMNNAGTATRFLIPVLCLHKGIFKLDGNARMRLRPIKDLIQALKQLGAKIEYLGVEGFLPLKIESTGILSGVCSVKSDISSQYLSGLLIAQFFGKSSGQSFEVKVEGKLVSEPYINLTKQVMADFRNDDSDFIVEGDASSATYWLAMGALIDGGIQVENILESTLQSDILILKALGAMGAVVKGTSVSPPADGRLKALSEHDCEEFPDGAMTLAVLCAFADGVSKLTGLSTLKFKESDRLEAIRAELKKIGVRAETTADSITVYGNPLHKFKAAQIETYDDHRIAMCFSLFKLFNPEIEILNPECVNKTYPSYWVELSITILL